MEFKGYMIEGDWTGNTLTVRGTNKASHYALVGPDMEHAKRVHAEAGQAGVRDTLAQMSGLLPDGSAVAIQYADIASVDFKDAGLLTNGCLDVRTHDGRRYQLHFLRKHREAFRRLASELAKP